MNIDPLSVTGYGIDVSHHQDPDRLDWEAMRGKADFVIARGCYGASLDRRAPLHVAHGRVIGARVGIYAFVRPKEPVESQMDCLYAAIMAAGIVPGDIAPCLDIEANDVTGEWPNPDWNAPLEKFCMEVEDRLSTCPILYMSRNVWEMLGSPDWPMNFSLWVPEYTASWQLRTPGDAAPIIWQHRVGPFELNGEGGYDEKKPELDQDRRFGDIPSLSSAIPESERDRIMGLVTESLREAANGVNEETDGNV